MPEYARQYLLDSHANQVVSHAYPSLILNSISTDPRLFVQPQHPSF
jgi:hypothetical protein